MRRTRARQRVRNAEFQRRCSRILKVIVSDLLKPAKPPPIRFDISPRRRKSAAMRLRIVQEWERFVRELKPVHGQIAAARLRFSDAVAFFSRGPISPATLNAWLCCYRLRGIRGLVDRRGRPSGVRS